MLARLTDRARRVLALANGQALDLHDPHVGPEHIVLGILVEGTSVAANVLARFGIEQWNFREEAARRSILSPRQTTGDDPPQVPPDQHVLEGAIRNAEQLQHECVGTEHLLLSVLDLEDVDVTAIFTACGAVAASIREDLIRDLGESRE